MNPAGHLMIPESAKASSRRPKRDAGIVLCVSKMIDRIIGKKIRMTQIFAEDGRLVPVTVLQAGPCSIVQVKDEESDKYCAVQIGFDDKRGKVTKPLAGHFKKAGVTPKRLLREVRLEEVGDTKPGDSITVEIFNEVKRVDVTGITKGKGFQGGVKRHNFACGPHSHGCRNVRRPGSIGCSATPARVLKGTKMPGHMGHVKRTVKNLEVIDIDAENNLLLVRGSVPGPNGSNVIVRKTNVYKKAQTK